jgi:hypothetical protein
MIHRDDQGTTNNLTLSKGISIFTLDVISPIALFHIKSCDDIIVQPLGIYSQGITSCLGDSICFMYQTNLDNF